MTLKSKIPRVGRAVTESPIALPAFLLAVALVLVAPAALALWPRGESNGGREAGQDETGRRVGRWGAASRDRLTVCVDAVNADAAAGATAKTETEGVLTDLASDPLWPEFNNGFPPPRVDQGCPLPVLYDPTVHLNGRVVSDAGYYYLQIYVIPQEDMERYGPVRFTSEESFCNGDSCSGVTTGLYATSDDLEDRPMFTDLVATAIGLRKVRP